MTAPLDPVEPVEPAEVAALLHWSEEAVRALMGGAFAADLPCGRLRARVAFGIYVLGVLTTRQVLLPALAVRAAVHAASGARVEDDKNLLVAWHGDKPRVGWFDGDMPPPIDPEEPIASPLRLPVVCIPGDRMWRDFMTGIGLLRERARAGSH